MATLKLGSTTAITESSGALTIASSTLTTPTIASMANCTFPAGHIIKIESIKGSGNHDLSSATSMTATGLKKSITFTAGNKILVIACIQVASWLGGTDTGTQLRLCDNTNSENLLPTDQYLYNAGTGSAPETDIEGIMCLMPELYAPSGTTIEIELYHANPWSGGGAGTPVSRVNKSLSTLTLMEVQA